jgi:hypothetical protein
MTVAAFERELATGITRTCDRIVKKIVQTDFQCLKIYDKYTSLHLRLPRQSLDLCLGEQGSIL